MLWSTEMILDSLKDYSSPRCRLQRLVDKGEYIQLKRGLYEDDGGVSGRELASAIYNPSYLSFEYALSFHGMIPETVCEYTSATCGKNRTKCYENAFGRYSYRDVPRSVFSLNVTMHKSEGHVTWIATPEKALCDELYKIGPTDPRVEPMEALLFDDLRIDDEILFDLDRNVIRDLSERYHCRNVSRLSEYLEEIG